jgi:hypothetical protein
MENYPGSDRIWHDFIDTLEKLGAPGHASAWAKRLCQEGRYHHGIKSCVGSLHDKMNRPMEEEWTCWNCDFKMKRTTVME